MHTFNRLESEVRGYCRGWPAVFHEARGCHLWDEHGRRYLDFFSGAGALNYGHNPLALKSALLEYIASDAVTHSLDMATCAKRDFLLAFERIVLQPRRLNYKLQFPGPTGTNAVEAALKLARKVTERHTVVSFTNAFHGMTLGSLALTANGGKRAGAGVPLGHSFTLPYAGYMDGGTQTLDYFESLLEDPSSGLDKPAAVIVETIQAEGGINVASTEWLRELRNLTRRHDILLIVDDIQVGCGRTGPFFSFEEAGIEPDMVCLSKSLSGYGLPLALVLIRPELDVWDPGEHNGTFRGHNPAFVTATSALEHFWSDDTFEKSVQDRAAHLWTRLAEMAERCGGKHKGRGMIQGIELSPGCAQRVARRAFDRGVLVETSGARSEVVKLLPPLVIDEANLDRGLDIVADSMRKEVSNSQRPNMERAAADARSLP